MPRLFAALVTLSVLLAPNQILGQQDGQFVQLQREPTVNELIQEIISKMREVIRRVEALESDVSMLNNQKQAPPAPAPKQDTREVEKLRTELAELRAALDKLKEKKTEEVNAGILEGIQQAEKPLPRVPLPNTLARGKAPVGDPGPRGEQGLQGEKGVRGERGPRGAVGPPGEKGITQVQITVEPREIEQAGKLPVMLLTSNNFCPGCPEVVQAVAQYNEAVPNGKRIYVMDVDAYIPSMPSGKMVFVGPVMKDFNSGETYTGREACMGYVTVLGQFVEIDP